MPDMDWQRVKAIVAEALEVEPAERSRFLDDACGEGRALRAEVDSILRQPDDSLLEPRVARPSGDLETSELVGKRISHYQVLGEVGRGGMGVVYRARDTRLGRDVAIKALRPDLALSQERLQRFAQEARSASALNHPHIIHVYDVGEHSGAPYIALEYVEGRTLRELLGEGRMPVERVVSLALQFVGGLVKAHSAGIVHRDLKPENLMVTADGHIKILDFGLAKLSPHPDSSKSSSPSGNRVETREGVLLGTAGYMSPEQARARGGVDFRSDQFSVGSILYEMATGQPAFTRDSAAQTMAAIIEDEPPPMSRLADVPAGLSAIVHRCLRKDPQGRYASTSDLLRDLTTFAAGGLGRKQTSATLVWGAALLGLAAIGLAWALWRTPLRSSGPSPVIASVAVLPFEDPRRDADRAYFVHGMTEGITNTLASVGALRVTAPNASLRYAGSAKPRAEVARELGVEALLEGKASLDGNRISVEAHLVQAPTGAELWRQTYDAELDDVLGVQADIARSVAQAVSAPLAPREEARLRPTRTVRPETYQAYLRGTYYLNQFTEEGFDRGIRHLHEAVASDPADPLAWAGLALGYNLLGHGPNPPPEAFDRARAAAERALSLDDSLADVHLVLGAVALYDEWDWPAAEHELRLALASNPSLAEARYHQAWYLVLQGRSDEGIAEMETARRLDPFTPKYAAWLGVLYWVEGRYDEALLAGRAALEVSPDSPIGWYTLGVAHLARGDHANAIAAHEKAAEHPDWRWPLATTLALAGQPAKARVMAAELARAPKPIEAWGLAEIHAALGERDEALRSLENCVDRRFSWIPWLRWYPGFASLRGDPRFHELERRIGLPL